MKEVLRNICRNIHRLLCPVIIGTRKQMPVVIEIVYQ
jgi:hypothetical protein